MLAMAKRTRRGRAAKDGERYACGKLRPEVVKATPETLKRRAELLAVQIRQHPEKWARELAGEGDAGWYIGRLYLLDVLTQRQRDAADRLKRAARAYEAVLGAPKLPHALDMDRIAGSATESDEGYTRRFKRAKAAYDRMYAAMADRGHDVVRAVSRALNDEEVNIDLLRLGLNAVDDV